MLCSVSEDDISAVCEDEQITGEQLIESIGRGEVVIMKNGSGTGKALAVGKGLKTKVNANIGSSSHFPSVKDELAKLKIAIDSGADAVMDLSTGGDIDEIRREIIATSSVAVGTVPIYQAAVERMGKGQEVESIAADELFEAVEKHAQDGVDFVTVHCGVTLKSVEKIRESDRLTGIVSRGGAILAKWIEKNERENPLYEDFDRLINISKRYDLTLSLGDGLRPGSIHDASDRAQFEELIILGELVKKCREEGVKVIVEGPGHVPLNEIEANVRIEKKLCDGAPFYVLGPIVTDIGAGFDHIVSAIGGAVAGAAGADFLCYVTPREHLGLPDANDVRQGVIASRIAAHAADIAKGVPGAYEMDCEMARARKSLDWERQIALSVSPEVSKKMLLERSSGTDVCSMCGEMCALKMAP